MELNFELKEVRIRVVQLLQDRQNEIATMVQESVDKQITTEYLQYVIDKKVKSTVEYELGKAIEHYYEHGEGSKQIDELVETYLGGAMDLEKATNHMEKGYTVKRMADNGRTFFFRIGDNKQYKCQYSDSEAWYDVDIKDMPPGGYLKCTEK